MTLSCEPTLGQHLQQEALEHDYTADHEYTLTIVAVSNGCQCGAVRRLQRYGYTAT
jgi:hypothetical protein